MSIDLTLRAVKGLPLTYAETDANFTALRSGIGGTVVVAVTGRYISADETKATFTNEGATDIVAVVLPEAAAGLAYTFIVQDADGMRVHAQDGNTIRLGADVWDAIKSVTVGSVVTLEAVNATEWFATSICGTWVEATEDIPEVGTYFNLVEDFGGVGDGITDNISAFLAFRTVAREIDGLVALFIPPGDYRISDADPTITMRLFNGIKRLTVSAYDATLVFSMSSIYVRFTGKCGITQSANTSARVDTVLTGATTATLKDITKASIFTEGYYVFLGAYELQSTNGYPPNHHFNQYVKITDITGDVITFTPAALYDYLDTYPETTGIVDGIPWDYDTGGPATLMILPDYDGIGPADAWDTEIEIRGLTIEAETIESGAQFYGPGKSISYIDMEFIGTAPIPGSNQTWYGENVTCLNANAQIEIDKETESVTFKNCNINTIAVQSSSVRELILDGTTITQVLNGTPKNCTIRGASDITSLVVGANGYGCSESLVIEAPAVIHDISGLSNMGRAVTVFDDNVSGDLTYSDYPIEIFPPGALVYIGQAGKFAGPSSTISDVTGTNVFTGPVTFHTGIIDPFPTLPTGAPYFEFSTTWLMQCPCIDVSVEDGVTGCEHILALAHGPDNLPFRSYYWYSGRLPANPTTKLMPIFGKLVSLKLNVTKAYTGPSSTASLKVAVYNVACYEPGTNSMMSFGPTVNAKILGERVITPGAVTGAQTGDVLGSAPGDIVFTYHISPNLDADVTGMAEADQPTFEIEILTTQIF